VCLLDYAGCPDDRVRLPPSSVTYPILFNSRGREPSSSNGGGGSASWMPAMLDFWARDKVAKIAGSQNPMARMDYGPVWMRREYRESLCHRWATGPWQERSQAAIRNQAAHSEKNVHTSGSVSYATHNQKLHHELERAPTFPELFDRTHKQKGTDDYETYDRTWRIAMQRALPSQTWIRRPRSTQREGRGRADRSSSLCEFVCCDTRSGGDDIRTLIRGELWQQIPLHLGAMVEQLVAAIRGAGTSQQAPQDLPAPDDHEVGREDDPTDLS
ncbi:hypothetical protein Taro_032016, partial [Colocasia esculenta]|nr:hypothetical protein [Colocasia esculenta]